MNAHDSIEATKLLQCVGRQSSVASSKMVSSLPVFGISGSLVSSVPVFVISRSWGSSAGTAGRTFAGTFWWLPVSSRAPGNGGDTCWPELPVPCWPWHRSPCAVPSTACDMTTSRVPNCMNLQGWLSYLKHAFIFLDARFSCLIECYKRSMSPVRNMPWPTCSRPNCSGGKSFMAESFVLFLLTAGNSPHIGILIDAISWDHFGSSSEVSRTEEESFSRLLEIWRTCEGLSAAKVQRRPRLLSLSLQAGWLS